MLKYLNKDHRLLLGILFFYAGSLFFSMALMELLSTLLIIAVSAQLFSRSNKDLRQLNWVDYLCLGFLLVVVLGSLLTPETDGGRLMIVGDARWTLLLMALLRAASLIPPKRFVSLVKLTSSAAILVGIYGIIQHFTAIDLVRDAARNVKHLGHRSDGSILFRSIGFFNSPMTFGNVMGAFSFIPLSFALCWKDAAQKWRWAFAASALLSLLATFSTFTRGVWLGWALGALVFFAFYSRKAVGAFVTTSAAALGIAVLSSTSFRDRLLSIFDPTFESNSERIEIWRAHFEIFRENPILGVGYRNNDLFVEAAYQKLGIIDGFVGHAHNNLIQILAGTGLLGAFFYVSLMVFFFATSFIVWRDRTAPRLARALALASLGSQAFLHIAGLTEANFIDAEVNHFLLFVFFLTWGAKRLHSEGNNKQATSALPTKL